MDLLPFARAKHAEPPKEVKAFLLRPRTTIEDFLVAKLSLLVGTAHLVGFVFADAQSLSTSCGEHILSAAVAVFVVTQDDDRLVVVTGTG